MNFAKITASASYTPERVVTNDELSGIVDTSDEWISSRTGIRERRISLSENTSDLCEKVCTELLSRSGLTADAIDLIIVATISPDYLTPSTACVVQNKIGAVNAFAFDLSAACSGFVYAVSVAHKYIAGGMCKNAIVLGAEVLSKATNWSDRATCVLFGDGAGGVILTRTEEYIGVLGEDLHSDGSLYMALTSRHMPVVNHFATDTETSTGQVGPYLNMNGKQVWDFAVKCVPQSIGSLLEQNNLSIDDIRYIIPHQANSRIVEMVAKKMGIDISKFYINIGSYGNTSAATIPIALAEMLKKGLLAYDRGDKIIIVGFGAGVTWGSILIEL